MDTKTAEIGLDNAIQGVTLDPQGMSYEDLKCEASALDNFITGVTLNENGKSYDELPSEEQEKYVGRLDDIVEELDWHAYAADAERREFIKGPPPPQPVVLSGKDQLSITDDNGNSYTIRNNPYGDGFVVALFHEGESCVTAQEKNGFVTVCPQW